MTRSRLLAASGLVLIVLTTAACGSDSTGDPQASSTPSTTTTTTLPAQTTDPGASATTPTPSATASTGSTGGTGGTAGTGSTGRLIDYEDADGNGVTIASAADASKLTGAPADFKAFLVRELAAQGQAQDSCSGADPQISVSKLDTGGWARGNIAVPGCGGAGAMWAKYDGAWTEAWTGQSLFDCSMLEKYRFPARVAGDTCAVGADAVHYPR